MDDIATNLIANGIWAAGVALLGLVLYLLRPFWRKILAELRPPVEHPASDAHPGPGNISAVELPPALSLVDKIVHLEQQRDEALAAAVDARRDGRDDRPFEERGTMLDETLREMLFIARGDVLADRYRLIARLGAGRVSTVWKAYDLARDKTVAVKLIRYGHINDESLVRRCHYTVRVMSELSAANIAAIYEQVSEVSVNGVRKLAYYVLEYVDGVPLNEYVSRERLKKALLIDGILELGRSLADAHAKEIVHRDLKPSNIVVQADGRMKLVDFDSVLRLGDRRVTHHDIGTFGYSAPEVLDAKSDPDKRADIFAMGRVVSYLYYGDTSLPNVYEQSVYDVIDLLNCAPKVKECLERATAVQPSERYDTMKDFLDDLSKAVAEDRDYPLPFMPTVRREWPKISKLLQQSFYGTFLLMILARPTIAALGLAHLSDIGRVGAFHAVIGAFVWGVFISGAFVFYLIPFGRRPWSRPAKYAGAAVACGVGGLVGGILVSVPSVLVTNERTLMCLGWLVAPAAGEQLTLTTAQRLYQALIETRMMLSYPLTGLFTGVGVGIALWRGIEVAMKRNPQGSGILPVPAKSADRAPLVGAGVMRLVILSPAVHVALACPIIFSAAVAYALDAAAPSAAFLVQSCAGVVPNELWRSVGEGVIHYCGAVGLVGGFFWRVAPSNALMGASRRAASSGDGLMAAAG